MLQHNYTNVYTHTLDDTLEPALDIANSFIDNN